MQDDNIVEFPVKRGFDLKDEQGKIIYSMDDNYNSNCEDVPRATKAFYRSVEVQGKGFLSRIAKLTRENKILKDIVLILHPLPLEVLPEEYKATAREVLYEE